MMSRLGKRLSNQPERLKVKQNKNLRTANTIMAKFVKNLHNHAKRPKQIVKKKGIIFNGTLLGQHASTSSGSEKKIWRKKIEYPLTTLFSVRFVNYSWPEREEKNIRILKSGVNVPARGSSYVGKTMASKFYDFETCVEVTSSQISCFSIWLRYPPF